MILMRRRQSRADSDAKERYQRIWATVAAIPAGCVASYGQIAELAGVPRGARLVGRVLHRAPPEMCLPWHRVITVQGKIALPKNSRAYHEQIRRLEGEGVTIIGERVDMSLYRWCPDLDELVWGPAGFEQFLPESER